MNPLFDTRHHIAPSMPVIIAHKVSYSHRHECAFVCRHVELRLRLGEVRTARSRGRVLRSGERRRRGRRPGAAAGQWWARCRLLRFTRLVAADLSRAVDLSPTTAK